ncbi:MAG TPA: hypothetical protein VF245_01480 [Solirubrobacterales bacterium]
MTQIAPESKDFLISLFTDLRNDLDERERGATEKAATYDALLHALDSGSFPDDDGLREYVVGLAEAIDKENRYEQTVLEHHALAELRDALTRPA